MVKRNLNQPAPKGANANADFRNQANSNAMNTKQGKNIQQLPGSPKKALAIWKGHSLAIKPICSN